MVGSSSNNICTLLFYLLLTTRREKKENTFVYGIKAIAIAKKNQGLGTITAD